jgi:NitT/TauT family transport system substrate-binding protein
MIRFTAQLVLLGLVLATSAAFADEPPTIRLAVLQYGTVSWELDTLLHHGLDSEEGIRLEITRLGSSNAAAVALQGGAVDAIVSDWIWVARQRADGRPWTLVPFSQAVGSLLVSPDSNIDSLADLAGKALGVAGGPLDKSWLLLRAYAQRLLNQDLIELVEPTYGAPPLLNELALRGDLPALINFWHYAARLQVAGFRPLISVEQALTELGVERPVPLLGWVFDENWAASHAETLRAFLRASYRAKDILATSDAEWERLRVLTRAEDDATLEALRAAFRNGIPREFGEPERAAAAQVFAILAQEGGAELVGSATSLPAGTFWDGFRITP